MELTFYFLLGAIIGSFLNVLILRRGAGISLQGRSFCDTCGETLNWYNLIPVISWVLQKGRCTNCSARISIQYPIVELITALTFLIIGLSSINIFAQFVVMAAFSLLIAMSVYDLRHTIIPDEWVYPFAATSFLFGYLVTLPMTYEAWIWLIVSGPIAALPLGALWLVSGGKWMGLGDVKLALGIGWILGPLWGVISIFGAFMIGALISVFILLPLPKILNFISLHTPLFGASNQSFTMKSEVPFGPFLACSFYISFIAQHVLSVPPFFLW